MRSAIVTYGFWIAVVPNNTPQTRMREAQLFLFDIDYSSGPA